MRYDAQSGCYAGEWLAVRESVFQRVLEARVAAGEPQDAALEDLLDELAWSLETPGVFLRAGRSKLLMQLASAGALPWQIRPRVPVLESDPARAAAMQRALEAAGMRAPILVFDDTVGIDRLRACLTPTPLLCVFGLTGALGQAWRPLHSEFPGCRFVLTAPAHEHGGPLPAGVQSLWLTAQRGDPASVAVAVRDLFANELAQAAPLDVRCALAIQRSLLLFLESSEQYVHALAFRGQARSLRKRDRRVRARAAMLCEESLVLRHGVMI